MNRQNIIDTYKKMGKNVMTPNVINWDITKDYRIVELSSGYGIAGNEIFGVSEFDETLDKTRRGKLFQNLKEAKKYYQKLLN